MKNKHILFSTVSCMIIFSFEVGAQCVMSQDCAALGYTQATSCVGGVKCPFGNKWYCPNTCDISGFPYTCTRTNESPSAAKCGDKYSLCNCATGLSWKDGSCKIDRPRCTIGWIYYSDNTCNADIVAGKTALGVVVYVNADGIGGQVMTASSLGKMEWGDYGTDIPSLPDYGSQSAAATDFNSCRNTDVIVAYGGSRKYPAAHAARNYAPTTETKGKWCLPAAGIMTSIKNNLVAVQAGISKLGGTAFPSCCTWSSSEYSKVNSWIANFGNSYGLNDGYKAYGNGDVRPVLEF